MMRRRIGIVIGKYEGGGISNVLKSIIENSPKKFEFFIISRDFRHPLPKKAKKIKVNLFNYQELKKIRKLDLLHFHGSVLMLLRQFAINIPSVYTHHGLTPCNFRGSMYEKIACIIVDRIYKLMIPLMDVCTGISKWSCIDLKKYGAKNIIYIPNGIDLNKFRPLKPKEKLLIGDPSLLYVGSLYPEKGIEDLIDFLPNLISIYPKIGLNIIGDGVLREKIILKIKKFKMENHVKLFGYIPNDKLPLYYNSCDIFIFPSRHESFGLPVLEAMACGKPVISRNTSNLSFLIRESKAGKLFRSLEELPKLIGWVLENQEKLKKNALKFVSQFDVRKTVQKYYSLYESLVER